MGGFFSLRKKVDETHRCTIGVHNESMSFLPPLEPKANCCHKFQRAFKKCTLISEYNPQSTEYFRSTAEILRIRRDHVYSSLPIIHPFSNFRAYYEMYMCIVWFLVILYFPANAAFDFFNVDHNKMMSGELSEKSNVWLSNIASDLLRFLCLIDIVITFFTGYAVKKRRKVIMRPLKIAKTYIVSIYFVTDLVCSLPIGFAMPTHDKQRIYDCLGFLRIVRLPTLYYYMSRTIEILKIRHISAEIVKNVITHFLVFHWFACFGYMIPQIRYFLNGEIMAESWVERTDLPDMSFISKYVICFYRATGGLFCITFENLELRLWEEKLIGLLVFLFGKVYVFYITVLILSYLLRQRSLEIKYFETISQVQAYMSQKQLPMSMQARLLHFYDYKYNKKFFKERGITTLLSEKLKREINLSVCSKLVQSVSLLAHLPQQHLEQIVTSLKSEIYLSNDIIIKAGSVGDCMYFLASGTVGVWTPSGKEVCHLQDGAYFGEISLVFKDKRRTANIVAIEVCEVYKLERKAFKSIFKTNSQLYKLLEDVANERMEITQMFEDVHAKTFMELAAHSKQS